MIDCKPFVSLSLPSPNRNCIPDGRSKLQCKHSLNPLIFIQPSPFGPVLFTQNRVAKHTNMGLRRCLGKDVHPFRFDCRPSLTATGR